MKSRTGTYRNLPEFYDKVYLLKKLVWVHVQFMLKNVFILNAFEYESRVLLENNHVEITLLPSSSTAQKRGR